jgi:hypothetical protein
MQALALPKAQLKITKKGNELFVWCVARKKTLVLTPEEWVRQHVIHYLVNDLKVPLGLIASEVSLSINKLSRRCDLIVFSKESKPLLLIECKAVDVPLTENVFHQIAQYNFKLNVDYLMMTNGVHHVYCKIDRVNNKLIYLEKLPLYDDLN